jgi:hypothetical protein
MNKEVSRVLPAKLIIIYLIISYLSFNYSYAHEFEHPTSWHNPEITKILKTAKVADIKPMKEVLIEQGKKAEFDGQVFLIILENGIKAVFKSLPLTTKEMLRPKLQRIKPLFI